MLDVNVTGGNKIKRELVEELARFVHAKLMPRKAVEVNIDIGDYEVFGLCGQIGNWPAKCLLSKQRQSACRY